LSEGRDLSGLGISRSKDEYQASNMPLKHRGKRADEFIQALKKIWTDDHHKIPRRILQYSIIKNSSPTSIHTI
jgi:alkanesulfonate monooxygenase SsuD/methylene tetrahydromethanopterin reductase-like flavin-dependent oxidoreductase (luciferase family)